MTKRNLWLGMESKATSWLGVQTPGAGAWVSILDPPLESCVTCCQFLELFLKREHEFFFLRFMYVFERQSYQREGETAKGPPFAGSLLI